MPFFQTLVTQLDQSASHTPLRGLQQQQQQQQQQHLGPQATEHVKGSNDGQQTLPPLSLAEVIEAQKKGLALPGIRDIPNKLSQHPSSKGDFLCV